MDPNSASPNRNPSNNSPRISLREALLQQITPAELAEAEASAQASLAGYPEEASPDPLEEESPRSDRHSRKCKICNSPDREDIDQAYIHWVPLGRIIREFAGVSSAVCIYRHAIATGLFSRRRSRFQHALDRIIEQAGDSRPSADAVIRAIRASSMLNENGRWDEPPRRVIIEHHVLSSAATPALTPVLLDASVTRNILEAAADNDRAPRSPANTSRPTPRKEAR